MKIRITRSHGVITQIEVSGHANSNEYGKDLVCAGVSSIMFGVCNAIDQLVDPSYYQIQISEDAHICIKALQSDSTLELILNVVYHQLKTVAFENKKYIKIQEV